MARNGSNSDYFQEALACIQHVHELTTGATGDRGELHRQQCRYLSSKVSETGGFLQEKTDSLRDISSVDDIRRKALRHLHFTVKRAETLVRSCVWDSETASEFETSWLEAAVTLINIKEEIVDILLDLQWWTSMVGIAIASVTSVASGKSNELELVTAAEEDFEKSMAQLLPGGQFANELDNAVARDKEELLKRVHVVLDFFRKERNDQRYLLATHVRSRLEDIEVTQCTADEELNKYELGHIIGWGTFGAVMMVKWLERDCAMKQLRNICPEEAMSLSPFQHPYIVQFFRYWEEPFPKRCGSSTTTPETSDAGLSPEFTSNASSPQQTKLVSKSHILMELLPLDLAAHMATGSEPDEQQPLSQDVAIDVMLQLAKAMWHLNNKDVVHRDLKPSNVLVRPVSREDAPELAGRGYLRMKLGDFGLAKTMVLSSAYSSQTANVGTKSYGAPEVFNNEAYSGRRFPRKADVWSYGMIFSEVLSGKQPFQGYARGTLNNVIKDGARPELPRACPDYLKFIIEQCWKYKQDDRPSFMDLWKMVRFAQVRSLGIIREDHQLFTFTTREGVVKRLHKLPWSGDFVQETLSCIKHLKELRSGANQLHHRQCQYLASEVEKTDGFLEAQKESLRDISGVDDIRRKALQHLHFTVKRAEMLVRSCFCEFETSWLEAAVTLHNIKEDIVDIMLDLQWWTSMVGIATASVTSTASGQNNELELVTAAEDDFEKLMGQLLSGGRFENELDTAVAVDKEELLKSIWEVQSRYANNRHDQRYLLATHLRSRLEATDVKQSMKDVELNAYEPGKLLGFGSFSAVMMVKWLGRDCALKQLSNTCPDEAMNLSIFQHPHIVQFFRYWEAPFSMPCDSTSPSTLVTLDAASSSKSTSSAVEQTNFLSKSHILMELLPLDLAQHMASAQSKSKVSLKLSATSAQPDGQAALPQDVTIDVMLQLAKAMWHLNSKDVAHRDLKPSNVLVRPVSSDHAPELAERGYVRVKLGDFGLAKTKAFSTAYSTQTKNVGSKLYGAPEVLNKDTISIEQFPRKADVWSYGVMFSEVLSGKRPFKGFALGNLNFEVKKGTRPELPRACPEYLKFIIEHCWKFKQVDRPNFIDLWKMVRFAQVRSLGIIRDDYQLFTFTTREGVVQRLHNLPPPVKDLSKPSSRVVQRLHNLPPPVKDLSKPSSRVVQRLHNLPPPVKDLSKPSSRVVQRLHNLPPPVKDLSKPSSRVVQRLHNLPPPVKDLSKPSSFGLLCCCITPRRVLSNHEQLQSENSDPVSTQQQLHKPRLNSDPVLSGTSRASSRESSRASSRASPHGLLTGRSDDRPLSDMVNEVEAPDALDVIFFEGNVGERKFLSCKDTWVQRGKPNVWWPRDWLVKDFKGEIRVLMLQYDISDHGVEGVVDELQRYLVFSEQWNREGKWDRPIVLVGHSLGCVVIEHLVVALNQKATSIDSVRDEFDGNRAKLAKAFLASLAGCFFYAPPYIGLAPHESLLKQIFGGLTYSSELFAELCLDSSKLQKLSEQFMLARSERVQLMALIEGSYTRRRTVVPPSSMQEFKGEVEELPDSDHGNTCKPTNKDHPAYQRLVEFIGTIQNERKVIQDTSLDKRHFGPGEFSSAVVVP